MRQAPTIVPHASRLSTRCTGVLPAAHVRCDMSHRGDVLPQKVFAHTSAPLGRDHHDRSRLAAHRHRHRLRRPSEVADPGRPRSGGARVLHGRPAGKLDWGAYITLLEQYLHLYRVLEATETRFAAAPELAGVLDTRLDRVSALEADLADLLVGTAPAGPTDATQEYVDHLGSLPADARERYFVHHYPRYLGDLSGGEVIGKLAARHYELPTDSLRTWRFDGIEKHKAYKNQYRAALDTASLTEAQREAFIDEARTGFILAKKLFDSLA